MSGKWYGEEASFNGLEFLLGPESSARVTFPESDIGLTRREIVEECHLCGHTAKDCDHRSLKDLNRGDDMAARSGCPGPMFRVRIRGLVMELRACEDIIHDLRVENRRLVEQRSGNDRRDEPADVAELRREKRQTGNWEES